MLRNKIGSPVQGGPVNPLCGPASLPVLDTQTLIFRSGCSESGRSSTPRCANRVVELHTCAPTTRTEGGKAVTAIPGSLSHFSSTPGVPLLPPITGCALRAQRAEWRWSTWPGGRMEPAAEVFQVAKSVLTRLTCRRRDTVHCAWSDCRRTADQHRAGETPKNHQLLS